MNINTELDSRGYLRLRTNVKGSDNQYVAKIKMLDIKIVRKSDFNKIHGKIRATNKDYIAINQAIEEQKKLFEFELTKEIEERKIEESDNSIIRLWKEFAETKDNYSTRTRYLSSLKRFTDFLNYLNIKNLMIEKIDERLILDYRKFLYQVGKNSPSTNEKDIGNVKSVINWIEYKRIYTWKEHPYKFVKISEHNKQKERLSEADFKNLLFIENEYPNRLKFFSDNYKRLDVQNIKYKYIDYAKLFKQNLRTRDQFIFMVFANGIRIKDCLTLKWQNFKTVDGQIRLYYTTAKTKALMTPVLPDQILKFLETFILESVEKYFDPKYKLDNGYRLAKEANNEYEINFNLRVLLGFISQQEQSKNKLVFTREENYNNILEKFDVNRNIEEQEKIIHSLTARFNSRLKDLQKLENINVKLTAHVARHQFTSLMLLDNRNLYDIQKSLSHSKLNTTARYTKSLESDGDMTTKTANSLTDRFFKK